MKRILTDCDGVLLDWENSFHEWMRVQGYDRIHYDITYNVGLAYGLEKHEKRDVVREFNNSAWMGYLNTFRDAFEGVQNLWLAGYKFDVITSMSEDEYAKRLRVDNLKRNFNPHFMDRFVSLDVGADKDEILMEYEGTGYWWIEDKPENCDAGLNAGLRSIIIDHPHNRDYNNPDVVRVNNWAEIVKIVMEDQVNEVA